MRVFPHSPMKLSRRTALAGLVSLSLLSLACEDTGKISAEKSKAHMAYLVGAAKKDAAEVSKGMPAGAQALEELFSEAAPEVPAAVDARAALVSVRAQNNDLGSAKSTFFFVASQDGTILRNNLDEDDMAGKNLFEVYPDAKKKEKDGYFEFGGAWEIARGANNREDAQRCAASAIKLKDEVVGYFVSGWSWSSYAYRLESSLRSEVLQNTKQGEKVPLLYVYVLVGDQAYGAPVAPVVNGKALVKLKPRGNAKADAVWTTSLEIERRQFGAALQRVPELGEDVVIGVLRSET